VLIIATLGMQGRGIGSGLVSNIIIRRYMRKKKSSFILYSKQKRYFNTILYDLIMRSAIIAGQLIKEEVITW
jgi:hypothetical protein